MATGPAVELTGTFGQQMAALLVVVLCAAVGGIIMQIIMRGVDFRTGKIGPIKINPLLTMIQIPPLVGMIIFGCLARNFLCHGYMQHYPESYASSIRNVCLSIILLRGGLELDFKGKGLTVVLLTLLPQLSEAVASAVASRFIFGMPWPLCFAQGFTLGAVSPAVLVPSLMILQKAHYGIKKGIPTTLIAASSFDDIIAITVFSIFLSIAFNQVKGGADEDGSHLWFEVGYNVIQILTGLGVGLFFGWSLKCLNYCSVAKTRWPKFFITLFTAILTPLICEWLHFPEAKYVGIIFFGYMCYMQWGEDKPEHELGVFWMFCQPFLFGTVGAAVLFSKISINLVGYGFGTILIGVSARWLGTFIAGCEKKYNNKERAFMAFAWIPKATVQAALGGMTLAKATKEDVPEFIQFGNAMLTTAVFAICLTAPLGAIMINTLGTKWLEYDGDDPELLALQKKNTDQN